MATLDEIGLFLATVCDRTVGVDLFKGQTPAAPDDCLSILEYGGREPEVVFGHTAISVDYPRIQVRSRGVRGDYATPRATAEAAYRAMAVAGAQQLGTTRYLAMRPLQPPFLFEKDDSGRITIAFNAELQKEPS